jgi:mono/diheme cytochrome c family protein/uncharacterized membrane protein
MTMRRFPVQLGLLAGLFFPLSLPDRLCAWPAALPAQTGAAKLFQQHCAKCHGADGTGSPARGIDPKIPDFTAASWQAQRSDAQLLVSIRDGKGSTMPGFGTKLKEEQVRGLVAHVRAFAPTKAAPKDAPAMSVEERLHDLEKQLEELRKQYDELSKGSAGGPAAKLRRLRQVQVAQPMAPMAAKSPAAGELFQRHCVKCHGADGTGSPARADRPAIPDFTAASWQSQRSDAQLLASILDGKASTMPAFRTKLKEEQVRALIAHVRVFATKTGHSEHDPEASPTTGPPDAEPPGAFLEQLIRWLGKSHPPAVHFPIALLTAAAVAEILRLTTRKPAFDAVFRYCLWFGTLTAVVAGVLGWFLGGFRLTDASWIMTMHRWLGTTTVICAVLVLVLCEVSRRSGGNRSSWGGRAALLVVAVLVLATGFFGGAVVFGLDHFSWPQ